MSTTVGTGFGWFEPSTQTVPVLGVWTPSSKTWAAITPGTAGQVLAVNPAGNGYQFQAQASAPAPTIISTATGALTIGNLNIVTFATAVTLTLPATAAQGSVITISGGAGGMTITPGATQSIVFGSATGATGATGILVTTAPNMGIQLICTTANTTFKVQYITNGSASIVT